MNKIKAHLSEVNTCIKQIDPEEENPHLNSALVSLKGAEEEIRVLQNKYSMLISELQQLND
jgi:hypothetical protein